MIGCIEFVWEDGYRKEFNLMSKISGVRHNKRRPINIEWSEDCIFDKSDIPMAKRWLFKEVLPSLSHYHSRIKLHKDLI